MVAVGLEIVKIRLVSLVRIRYSVLVKLRDLAIKFEPGTTKLCINVFNYRPSRSIIVTKGCSNENLLEFIKELVLSALRFADKIYPYREGRNIFFFNDRKVKTFAILS